MKLNIQDRLILQSLLPKENNLLDYRVKRDITNKTALTQEDVEKFSVTVDEESKAVKWDLKKDLENPLEVEFSQIEAEYIKRACEKTVDTPQSDAFWDTVNKFYEMM